MTSENREPGMFVRDPMADGIRISTAELMATWDRIATETRNAASEAADAMRWLAAGCGPEAGTERGPEWPRAWPGDVTHG